MKKIIIIFTTSLISTFYVYSQVTFQETALKQYSKEVPNYIKAENSNFVIEIIPDVKFKRENTYDDFTKSFKLGDFEMFNQIIEPELFDTLSSMIRKRLEVIGLFPKRFVNISSEQFYDTIYMKKQKEEFIKNKTGFIISIFCVNFAKGRRDFKKGKYTLENFTPITLSISKPANNNSTETFLLFKNGLSIEEALVIFKTKIEEKPSSYFIKTMEIP